MNSDSQNHELSSEQFIPCSLMRRAASMVYDFILLGCILFIAWLPMPLISALLDPVVDRLIRSIYLLAVCFFYFAWPWCRGGQTLGMRSWHIRLIDLMNPDHSITLKQAWFRFMGSMLSWAALGAGFLVAGFHPQKLAWHDLMSGTRLIRLSGGFGRSAPHEQQHKDR